MAILISGQIFDGKWRLLRRLGDGGFSEVWLARHLTLDEERVLKVMNPLVIAPRNVERFNKEARTMAKITHPNVVKVLDVGVADGRPYLVMEYHPSVDLHRLMDDGRLTHIRALEIVADVLKALAVVHDRGIIHRDVKPENVLVGTDGVTRLTDFGIAQVLEGESRMTMAREVIGTLRYMAPEQKGSLLQALIESDLYSVGVMIYELLGGEIPADPGTTVDLFVAEVRTPKLAGFQASVRQLLERALQYSPDNRYRSAEEMQGAVMALRRQMIRDLAAAEARQTSAVRSDPGVTLAPPVEPPADVIAAEDIVAVSAVIVDPEPIVAPTPVEPVEVMIGGDSRTFISHKEEDPFADPPEPERHIYWVRYGIGAIIVLSLAVAAVFVWQSADTVESADVAPLPEVVGVVEPQTVPPVVPLVPEPISLPPAPPVVDDSPRLSLEKKSTAKTVAEPPAQPVLVTATDPQPTKAKAELQHQPIASLAVATLTFKAQAPASSTLVVYYRTPGDPWQEPVSFKETSPGTFEAVLSSADFTVSGLDYFLEAKFPDGQSRKTGIFKVR